MDKDSNEEVVRHKGVGDDIILDDYRMNDYNAGEFDYTESYTHKDEEYKTGGD